MRIMYRSNYIFYDILYLNVIERADDTAILVFIINTMWRFSSSKRGSFPFLESLLLYFTSAKWLPLFCNRKTPSVVYFLFLLFVLFFFCIFKIHVYLPFICHSIRVSVRTERQWKRWQISFLMFTFCNFESYNAYFPYVVTVVRTWVWRSDTGGYPICIWLNIL